MIVSYAGRSIRRRLKRSGSMYYIPYSIKSGTGNIDLELIGAQKPLVISDNSFGNLRTLIETLVAPVSQPENLSGLYLNKEDRAR